jgi:hypothetical protein
MVVSLRWGFDIKTDWPTDRRSLYNSLTSRIRVPENKENADTAEYFGVQQKIENWNWEYRVKNQENGHTTKQRSTAEYENSVSCW